MSDELLPPPDDAVPNAALSAVVIVTAAVAAVLYALATAKSGLTVASALHADCRLDVEISGSELVTLLHAPVPVCLLRLAYWVSLSAVGHPEYNKPPEFKILSLVFTNTICQKK